MSLDKTSLMSIAAVKSMIMSAQLGFKLNLLKSGTAEAQKRIGIPCLTHVHLFKTQNIVEHRNVARKLNIPGRSFALDKHLEPSNKVIAKWPYANE